MGTDGKERNEEMRKWKKEWSLNSTANVEVQTAHRKHGAHIIRAAAWQRKKSRGSLISWYPESSRRHNVVGVHNAVMPLKRGMGVLAFGFGGSPGG